MNSDVEDITDQIDRDGDGISDAKEMKLDILKDSWENRRAMAWLSFISALIYPFVAVIVYIFGGEDARELSGVLVEMSVPFYTFVTFVLTSYFIFSSWEKVKGNGG